MFHLFAILKHVLFILLSYFQKNTFYPTALKTSKDAFVPYAHPHKKPVWVKERVIYLKAHLPHDGCRKIAMRFNTIYADQNISVSKSYVYSIIKENNHEILKQRKKMRSKIPFATRRNRIWHMDLTTVGKQQILGVVDGGTRALLILKHLPTKSTVNILIALLEAIRDYGKPHSIRSDNESVFTSRHMRFVLWLLGIRRQTTQIASPWQNGKIERLFGTMKQAFEGLGFRDKAGFPTTRGLQEALKEFRFFYNHIRLHQNLNYNTPANAWEDKPISTSKKAKEIFYYEGLYGNVAGFYLRE